MVLNLQGCKSRGTGIICPSCKTTQNSKIIKEKIQNNEMSKIANIEQEFNFIMQIKEKLKDNFNIVKAFDGCKVDIIFKPNNIQEDKWVGIQVKTTKERRLTYSFHINNYYDNCLLMLHCIDDDTTWIIPENIIGKQCKISIGFNKSKYNIYKIRKEDIASQLYELYKTTRQYSFNELNLPLSYYQQREQDFRKYREEKLPFIKFDYNEMEGHVYDFKIANYKIQEKVSIINPTNNKCYFCIIKNDGNKENKRCFKKYDTGDNDFYWLNCDDKKTFFLIPEKILIDKGIIGNDNQKYKKQLKITIQTPLHKKTAWLAYYMFDYTNLDKERLLNLLSIPDNI